MPAICANPRHDHFGQLDADANGGGNDADYNAPLGRCPDALICGDCKRPMHYDRDLENYRHDDPSAPACFLIRFNDGSRCQP